MNDKDIAKLVAQLTVSLATKDDIESVRDDIESVRDDIKKLERKLGAKIDEVDQKASDILKFAEAVDETTTDLDQRVKRMESIPVIAHEIRKRSK